MYNNYLQTQFQYVSSFGFECEYHDVDSEYFQVEIEEILFSTYLKRKTKFINKYIKKINMIYLNGHENCIDHQRGIEGILKAIQYKQYYLLKTEEYEGFKLVYLGTYPLQIWLDSEESIQKMRNNVQMCHTGILAWWDDGCVAFVIDNRVSTQLVEAIQEFMKNVTDVKEIYPNGIILKCE